MLRKKSKILSLFSLLLVLVLVLAACADQNAGEGPVVEDTGEGEEAAPVEEAAGEEAAAPDEAEAGEAAGEEPAAEEAAAEAPEISQPIYRWGEVADRNWVLVAYGDALNPTVVEEGLVITANFSSTEGQVTGSGGCNNYFAGYESTDDGGLLINGPIGSTMMACPEGMETEAAYFLALEVVTNWELTDTGRLELAYDSGSGFEEKLIYVPGDVPLTGQTWRLVSFGDPQALNELEEGTAITIEFEADTDTSGIAGGNATCNNYTTSYELDGDAISFGPVAGTMMMCPAGMDQETTYLAALESAQRYRIVGSSLQIGYEGGVLNYTALNLPLENVLWQAVMINGGPVPEYVEITALFVPGEEAGIGSVGGSAGCNNYNTGYELSSDVGSDAESEAMTNGITIEGPMAMTMMLCPDEELNGLEQAFLGALETAESFAIEGQELTLTTSEGAVIFTADREPLVGPLWSLVSLGSVDDPQPPVEGSNFTAQFSRLPILPSGTVSGETGCNEYNASFAADLSSIKINLPAKTNNEDCPWGDGNYEVEQQFFLGMNAATSYRIIGNTLQLLYGEGDDQQALNFVATQPEVEEGALDLTPLDNTFWHLAAIGDIPILSGSEVTAGFEINDDGLTGQISGSGGCNAYNAALGENFALGPMATTAKACAPALMAQEGTYFEWLQTAYGFDRAGDQLLLSTGKGILTYHSEPVLDQALELQNTTWYMISYGAFEAIAGSNPTAVFSSDGQSVGGRTGCNDFNGAYQAGQGNTLAISDISTTRAACVSDELQKQEETYLRLLPAATNYSVNGNQLQVLTVDGQTINFSSIAPEAPEGPVAVINGPTMADAGQQLTFDAAQSTAGSAPIAGYEWQMGDEARLTGRTVQYTYNAPGTYTVTLTVFDRAGQSDSTSQQVQVAAVVEVTPPTAVIEGPAMAFVGEPVTFSAANSQEGTAAITQYLWQSGDGNDSGPVAEKSFTTIYSQPGTYYPAVLVADAGGLSDSASMAITINATLEGSSWSLTGTDPGTAITLNFGNGSLSGFAGCNNYNASFSTSRAAGNTNSISVGPISSSSMACPEPVMNQEQSYLSSLQTASSYTINGATLTLTTAEGPLTFSAAVATPYVAP